MITSRPVTAPYIRCLVLGASMALQFAPAAAATVADICTQWGLQGPVYLVQSNRISALLLVEQTGSLFKGTASYSNKQQQTGPASVIGPPTVSDSAPVVGTLIRDEFEATVYWTDKTIGVYKGRVGRQGLLVGRTFDKTQPSTSADFHSDKTLVCLASVEAASLFGDVLGTLNGKPRVLAPTPGGAYRPQTAMTIRVAPGKTAKDTSYELEIQRRVGDWRAVANIPVSAAVAQSGLGYEGWGAHVDGGAQAMTATIGAYRVRAMATAPSRSVPSDWVEFKVAGTLGLTDSNPARTKQSATTGARAAFALGTKAGTTELARTQAHGTPLPAQASLSTTANKADAVALNPQPLPPKAAVTPSPFAKATNKTDAVSLNPQPLPPQAALTPSPFAKATNKADAVALNPQPLPPGSPVLLPNQAPSALR